MEQKTLEEVPEWIDAKEHNTAKRLNWKLILGKQTINEFVAEKRAQGYKKNEIEGMILGECVKNESTLRILGFTQEELERRVRIGVGARMAEMDIAKVHSKKGMYEVCSWTAKIRYENGKNIIIVSPKVGLTEGQYVKVSVELLKEVDTDG
jgi:hypothetical protein